MNRYARISPKEKLRMTRDLVKSNNKKIKKALDHINRFLAETVNYYRTTYNKEGNPNSYLFNY